MSKIHIEAFGEQMKKIAEEFIIEKSAWNLLIRTAHRQVIKSRWQHGQPSQVFWQDGYPCIRYSDGMYWHYDLIKGTWF